MDTILTMALLVSRLTTTLAPTIMVLYLAPVCMAQVIWRGTTDTHLLSKVACCHTVMLEAPLPVNGAVMLGVIDTMEDIGRHKVLLINTMLLPVRERIRRNAVAPCIAIPVVKVRATSVSPRVGNRILISVKAIIPGVDIGTKWTYVGYGPVIKGTGVYIRGR